MSMTANAQQMNFKTADLIAKLESNRQQHVTEYYEAVKGYKEKIEETLSEALAKFKADPTIYDKNFIVTLPTPVSYEKEYTTIIEMLTFCTDETIMLDRGNFQNFVLDEWNWKNSFASTAGVYNVGGALSKVR